MAKNVHSLGAAISATMLDDQKALMHVSPLDENGNAIGLNPNQPVPTYKDDGAGVVTEDPTVDPTGLSCTVLGVKGKAGTSVVTATYTNADGTTATGSCSFTTTIDPLELDVATLNVTVDPAVSQ